MPERHGMKDGGTGYGRDGQTSALIRRLRRIEGQVGGIRRMIEEGRYCVDVLNQIDAVTAALARVQDRVLESHINHCVADALEGADARKRRSKVDEVIELLRSYRRTR
jgi:DNA-binding FrmR family transcriptional regulator